MLYQEPSNSNKASQVSQASNEKPFKTPLKISNSKNKLSNSDSEFDMAIKKSI